MDELKVVTYLGDGELVNAHSDLKSVKLQSIEVNEEAEDAVTRESWDTVGAPLFQTPSYSASLRNSISFPVVPSSPNSHGGVTGLYSCSATARNSISATGNRRPSYFLHRSDSVTSGRSPSLVSSKPSLASRSTSLSAMVVENISESETSQSARRPSILSRLRSSISSFSSIPSLSRRPSCNPSDFQERPEYPEKHFIDSIGMVIPGVCNRTQCAHPLSHFMTNWRLSEPIEYTTVLADHGITYTDYCRLIAALQNFLDELPSEPKPREIPDEGIHSWHPSVSRDTHTSSTEERADPSKTQDTEKRSGRRISMESLETYRRTDEQAENLQNLLADITYNWRSRGVPVMVCVGSFSIFTPNRISDAHIQILHVELNGETKIKDPSTSQQEYKLGQRLCFVDPFSGVIEAPEPDDHSVSVPHSRRNSSLRSNPSSSPVTGIFHHHQVQLRDRTKPWPLWPNAIPTTKRSMFDTNSDRYGADPYFRSYIRASVNSETRATSYAEYMIERKDDVFVNKRLEYVKSPSNVASLWATLTRATKRKSSNSPTATNRDRYENNRRLECRKTVEVGSRLRLARSAFRNPIFPPHTPEMDELGLSKDEYEKIIADIDGIRRNEKLRSCGPKLVLGFAFPFVRHRNAEDVLAKVSQYIRNVNARKHKVVWTIETIPEVYASSLGSQGKEWEISVWNGEDPLELLLQLEKWGIIEKRLDIDEDE